MAGFSEMINRDASDDPLVPVPVATEIIKSMPESSALLRLARQARMSSKTYRQPVLSLLPRAYWVTGDTGLKQTDNVDWENKVLTAEELAVIIPIPEAYLDDAQVDVWAEVRPLLAEAFGLAVDLAGLWGVDKPAGWTDAAIGDGAVTAGNVVLAGSGTDLAQDVANLAVNIAEDGYDVNGFVTSPGFRWRLVGQRSADGTPIYAPPAGPQPGTLYGFPVQELKNGGFPANEGHLIAGDWSKAIVGMRQDITFKIFTEGVISDDSGAVVLNLMQQDSVALRAVMRVGFAVANPVNRVKEGTTGRYPFGLLGRVGS